MSAISTRQSPLGAAAATIIVVWFVAYGGEFRNSLVSPSQPPAPTPGSASSGLAFDSSVVLQPSRRFGGDLGSNDALAAARLSAKEVREIIAGAEQSAFDTPDSWNKELRARRVDLGSSPGIVLQGTKLLCGGTGNCQLFVFRQLKGKWVSPFAGERAPIVEAFQFGPGISHGIKDLTVVANASAETGQRITYRFDGGVYRAE